MKRLRRPASITAPSLARLATATAATSATHATSAASVAGASRHQTPPPCSGAARDALASTAAADATPAAIPDGPRLTRGHHSSRLPPGTSTTASARSATERTHVRPRGGAAGRTPLRDLAPGLGSGAPGALEPLGTSRLERRGDGAPRFPLGFRPSSHASATHSRLPGLAASIHSLSLGWDPGVVSRSVGSASLEPGRGNTRRKVPPWA